jgi:hypothetical protein
MLARVTGSLSSTFDMRSIIDEVAEFTAELDSPARPTRGGIAAAMATDPTVRASRPPRVPTRSSSCSSSSTASRWSISTRLGRAGHDPAEVARRIGRLYARMIFEQGFFRVTHPKPAVMPGTVIGLDFGLAKELPPGFGPAVASW